MDFARRLNSPGITILPGTTFEGVDPDLSLELLGLGYGGSFAVEYQWEDGWLDFTCVDCVSETTDMRDLLVDGAVNGGSR